MRNTDVRRPLVIVLATLAFAGGGASLVLASGGGSGSYGEGAAHHQYKPGCGPDKTDGVAGNSGRHQGQPPKDQNRGDCPNPPGQQDKGGSDDTMGSSSSSSSSSSKKK